MSKKLDQISVHICPEWIQENRDDFKPPVCNKCMFNDQQKVFFVGGPNERKDFHLELGEELFYQVEGDMVLKIVKNGQLRDISIKQGELFLLSARVLHSPQRFKNTVGCVIERARQKHELDCLRYFTDGTTKVLWEKWFHMEDVVKDLPPVINEFKNSPQSKSGAAAQVLNSPAGSYLADESGVVPDPIALNDFISKHWSEISTKSPIQVYGPPTNKSLVLLYGEGKHSLANDGNGDMIVMTLKGETRLQVVLELEALTLGPFTIAQIRPSTKLSLCLPDGAVCITVKVL